MAVDASKIMAGAGVFSIGAYVTAGGAGSLTDAGHIKSPYELGVSMENFDETTERSTGIVKTVPIQTDFTLKVALHEATTENLRVSLGQPSANVSGSGNNKTILVGDRAEQYHQATLVVPGPGTLATRTMTYWKLQVISMEPISFGKSVAQMYNVTFRALRDDTVTTADKHFKQVDT